MDLSTVVAALSTAFSSIDEAVLVIGHEPRTILACNAAAERMFGWSSSEVAGQTTRVLHVDEAHFTDFATRGDPDLERSGVFRTRYPMRRRDGRVFEALVTVVLLHRERGIPGGAVSIICDASEIEDLRRRLTEVEGRFVRSQKLEVAGRLVAGLAHDLNNYLTVVAGNAEGLSDADLTPSQRTALEALDTAVRGAVALNQRIVSFVRREGTGGSCELGEAVRSCERLLRTVVGSLVAFEPALADEELRVPLDLSAVEQVLLNLALNAKDAMPTGGELALRTRSVGDGDPVLRDFDAPGPGPHALLELVDTGEGMSEAVRSRIFEPFFTTRPAGSGSGLGLLAVRELVRSAGGRIRFDSTPGKGTRVRILLPLLPDA